MRARSRALAVVALALPALAHAAHPFVTEDPGTQGTGHFELELGFGAFNGDPSIPGRTNAFAPQFSIGVLDNVDLIAQAVRVSQTPADGATLVGQGSMLLDVKWRFKETDDYALGVRAGLDLPVGDASDNLASGQLGAHAIGILSVTVGEYAVYANAGYAFTRQPNTRRNVGAFSIALTRPDDKPLRGFVEAATYANPDPSRSLWPAFARAGAIWSVNEWLDVDAGVQARLNSAAARVGLLAGMTLRW
ncbi:MAG: transporter [Burkholderiales bacterium]